MRVHVIEFQPARLLHVALPKTGSTSLLACYLMMAGLVTSAEGVRPFLRSDANRKRMQEAGIQFRRVNVKKLPEFRQKHPDWAMMATVRNPYDRALSNWFSKINRFAKHHARGLYLRGKLVQLLSGPKAWSDIAYANRAMQARLSFAQFLDGLRRSGIDFDNHFRQQSDLLALDRMTYDHLFRLEDFDATFRPALQGLGVPDDLLARLAAIPHSNETGSRKDAQTLLTAETRQQIETLYDRDFRLLGYERDRP